MQQVGFLGVGQMGGAIAARMVQQGVPVLAFDVNAANLEAARLQGCSVAGSVREVAEACEIVFACLPNAEVCEAVALGADGVLSGGKTKVYVETSTVGGEVMTRLADGLMAQGVTLLDSPIVGGGVALAAGTAGVLVSGPQDAFEQAKYALETYAGRLFYLGPVVGAAQAAKAMNNAVAYASFMATCEAVAIGMKSGLDLGTAVAVINQGSGCNFFSEKVFPGFILQGRYEGTGAIEIGVKDVKCFLEEAERLQVEAPMASAVSKLQKRVAESGRPGRDTLEALHFFTDLAGVPRTG